MRRFLYASYGMYLLGGITSVFFGAVFPELLSHYRADYTLGGLLMLLQSIGFIIGVPLTAALMEKYHYRLILSGSALLVVVAQLGVTLLPPLFVLDLLLILNGIGASALETAVASYIMERFEGRRAIYMSRLEVAFGVGALGMPAVASGLIALHLWRFSSLFVALFALILAVFWQTVSASAHMHDSPITEGEMDARTAPPPMFGRKLQKYSILGLFLIMIFVYVGVEGSLNSFLPSMFLVYVHVHPYFAALSSSVFWVAMVCGRLLIGWIARHVSYERYLAASLALMIVFLFILTHLHTSLLSYITVFGLGLAMSAVYSITMVYANHTFPGMQRTVTSAVTAFAGIGGAVFPAITGYSMDHLLPGQVVWLLLAFAVLLFICFSLIYSFLRWIRDSRTEL